MRNYTATALKVFAIFILTIGFIAGILLSFQHGSIETRCSVLPRTTEIFNVNVMLLIWAITFISCFLFIALSEIISLLQKGVWTIEKDR